jgi:hypothetical protein
MAEIFRSQSPLYKDPGCGVADNFCMRTYASGRV